MLSSSSQLILSGDWFKKGNNLKPRTASLSDMEMIRVNLDKVLKDRKITSKDLAEQVGITEANLSILKTGKAKGIRFNTLMSICRILDCQPGDLLEYHKE